MEIEINDKKTNAFFKRTEVHFTIKHENQGTPNQAIIRNELAEAMNVKKEAIIIEKINSSYGLQHTKGYAKVYSSRKDAEKIEQKHILNRNKVSEKKPKKKEEKEEEPEAPKEESSQDEYTFA
jgi:ribosomal protein S24E